MIQSSVSSIIDVGQPGGEVFLAGLGAGNEVTGRELGKVFRKLFPMGLCVMME